MATRVIIAKRLRTPKTFKERICSQNHIFDLLNTAILPSGDLGNILHNTLRRFCLPSTRFPRNNDTLILVVRIHVVISTFCYAENMWRHFKPVLPPVLLKCLFRVDPEVYKYRSSSRSDTLASAHAPRNGLTEIKTAPI